MTLTVEGEYRNTTGAISEKGGNYSRSFLLISDNADDSEVAVLQTLYTDLGIFRGVPHPEDPYAFCDNFDCRRDADDGLSWICTVNYKYSDTGPMDPCPWHQPAEVSRTGQPFNQRTDFDANGALIQTSAREHWAEPIERTAEYRVITITQAEHYYDDAVESLYANKVNANEFWGCEERTLKSGSPSATKRFDRTWGQYWEVTRTFTHKPDTWDLRLTDKGFMQLTDVLLVVYDENWEIADVTSGTKQAEIRINGAKPVNPVYLDGHGKPLAEGADPVYLTFEIYEKVPFRWVFRT